MAALKAGDRVQIAAREVTSEDAKTGLYFAYFGGLTGKVDRFYDDGAVCVEIDLDSLEEDARKRHLIMQESERKRWLDNLSNEVRNRLTDEQKQLKISYKLLINGSDVIPYKGEKAKPAKDDAVARATEAELAAREEEHLRSIQQGG